MHYKELIKGVNAYASKKANLSATFPNQPYEEERENYFVFLENNRPLIDRVSDFLKKWNPRVPADEGKLKVAVEKVPIEVYTLALVEVNLWDFYEKITRIFQDFINTGKSRKNYTGAAKALHIINPKFFPMWDGGIRQGYGCCENGEGYFNFMLRSQKEISKIINTYLVDFPSDTLDKLSNKIYSGKPKPILKLLDEYNWVKKKKWI